MIVADQQGLKRDSVSMPSRWSRRQVGIAELTGLEGVEERDAAIIALALQSQWSVGRLAKLFDLSERWVYKILSDFRRERAGDCS